MSKESKKRKAFKQDLITGFGLLLFAGIAYAMTAPDKKKKKKEKTDAQK